MARLPPSTSPTPALADARARLAQFDVKASRYVGAVLAGQADGVEPPTEEMAALALHLSGLLDTHPAERAQLRFHIREFTEGSALLTEALSLERAGAQGPARSSASAALK